MDSLNRRFINFKPDKDCPSYSRESFRGSLVSQRGDSHSFDLTNIFSFYNESGIQAIRYSFFPNKEALDSNHLVRYFYNNTLNSLVSSTILEELIAINAKVVCLVIDEQIQFFPKIQQIRWCRGVGISSFNFQNKNYTLHLVQ
jgi:hypothetical protein